MSRRCRGEAAVLDCAVVFRRCLGLTSGSQFLADARDEDFPKGDGDKLCKSEHES